MKSEREIASADIRVTHLSWERVFLHVTVETVRPARVFQLKRFTRKTIAAGGKLLEERDARDDGTKITIYDREIEIFPCETKAGEDVNVYEFTLNIAAMDGKNFLDNGKWQLTVIDESGNEYVAVASYELAYKLDDLDKIYKYGDNKFAYNVTFSTYSDDGTLLKLEMHSYFVELNNGWKKRRYVKEAITKKGKLKRMYYSFAVNGMRAVYAIAAKFAPKKGNRILFMSETKPYLWGNLKYINDRMLERGLNKQFEISYSFRKAVGSHKSVKSWAKLILTLAKQDYVFVDDYALIFGFLTLCDKTKLIQVWHAGEGFKAVGYCRFGKPGTPFPTGSCHKKYDIAITPSKRLIHVYSEVFGLPESNFMPLGMARLDGYLDEKKIEDFKTNFYAANPKLVGKKIILFAPTYRGIGQQVAYYGYDQLDMERIYELCGEEYVWAFKMHPFVTDAPPIPPQFRDRIIDFSAYENINDLYYVTEILITDYSSAFFEYSLLERPTMFFTYDRESYELSHGVHKSIKDTAPGKVCDTFEELMTAIINQDFEIEKTLEFAAANFEDYEGNASDRIIDEILLRK